MNDQKYFSDLHPLMLQMQMQMRKHMVLKHLTTYEAIAGSNPARCDDLSSKLYPFPFLVERNTLVFIVTQSKIHVLCNIYQHNAVVKMVEKLTQTLSSRAL